MRSSCALRGMRACRWHNQLNPDDRKDPFTDWEDAVIIQVRARRSGCGSRAWAGAGSRRHMVVNCLDWLELIGASPAA